MTINDDYHSVIAGFKEHEERFRRLAIIRAIFNPKRPGPQTPLLPGLVDIKTKERASMKADYINQHVHATHNGRELINQRDYRTPIDDAISNEEGPKSLGKKDRTLALQVECLDFMHGNSEFKSAAQIAESFSVTRSYATQICNRIADALGMVRVRDEETCERNREARNRVVASQAPPVGNLLV